jgi:hypothetical protein
MSTLVFTSPQLYIYYLQSLDRNWVFKHPKGRISPCSSATASLQRSELDMVPSTL